MLTNEQNDEECDTTGDAKRTGRWEQNKTTLKATSADEKAIFLITPNQRPAIKKPATKNIFPKLLVFKY